MRTMNSKKRLVSIDTKLAERLEKVAEKSGFDFEASLQSAIKEYVNNWEQFYNSDLFNNDREIPILWR